MDAIIEVILLRPFLSLFLPAAALAFRLPRASRNRWLQALIGGSLMVALGSLAVLLIALWLGGSGQGCIDGLYHQPAFGLHCGRICISHGSVVP